MKNDFTGTPLHPRPEGTGSCDYKFDKLNPTYGWKGKVENMEKAKAQIAEEKIIDFQEARERQNPSSKINVAAEDIPY